MPVQMPYRPVITNLTYRITMARAMNIKYYKQLFNIES